MPSLILLNGPPASGKSTIAAGLVARRPLALNLDVDAVRNALGAWFEQPEESGLAARRLALSMASTHLADGHDVVVPQLLARDTFLRELEEVAESAGARFIEIALVVEREAMVAAFEARSSSPENQQHRDARQLVEQSGGTAALVELFDRLMAFLTTRPQVRRVEPIRGDIDATLQLVESAILRP
ncbi:MAG: AAA family ATPase [Ilumatobacteraceae bacterium]